LTSTLPSRASQPTAIDIIGFGAFTPFSKAVRLAPPFDRKKFQTKPAVSPIVSNSHTGGTSLFLVWHLKIDLKRYSAKIFRDDAAFDKKYQFGYFDPQSRGLASRSLLVTVTITPVGQCW
jgi:hypothetical protein